MVRVSGVQPIKALSPKPVNFEDWANRAAGVNPGSINSLQSLGRASIAGCYIVPIIVIVPSKASWELIDRALFGSRIVHFPWWIYAGVRLSSSPSVRATQQ